MTVNGNFPRRVYPFPESVRFGKVSKKQSFRVPNSNHMIVGN